MQNKLQERVVRIGKRLLLKKADLIRFLSWHSGGKSLYYAESQEIISRYKWVFLVGCNNSGTTILQRLLSGSPEVKTFAMEGQRYTTVLSRAYKKHYERVWSEYADELMMSEDPTRAQQARIVHDWMTELGNPQSPVILEKTPANVLRMEWLQKCFPNSYFIGLVRNGYAVAEGIRRKGKKSIGRAAKHWGEVNNILLVNAQNVTRYQEIRYEDLVTEPDKVAQQLADFVGITVEPLKQAAKTSFQFNTVAGEGSQPLRNFNLESIKRLDVNDIELIRKECGEMLERFGYTAD